MKLQVPGEIVPGRESLHPAPLDFSICEFGHIEGSCALENNRVLSWNGTILSVNTSTLIESEYLAMFVV